MTEEDIEKRILFYEEAFLCTKEATEVSMIQKEEEEGGCYLLNSVFKERHKNILKS